MLDRIPRPLIFAHRGASACAPENTLAAFDLAVKQGAPAVELDAKLTSDGHIIAIHDRTVDRTTNGTGEVKNYTLTDIQKLDAGSWIDPSFAGEHIPTLEEVFQLLKGKVYINVELTNYANPRDGLVERVVELVRRMDISDQVLFSSFSIKNVRTAKKLMPETPCGLLAIPRTAWIIFAAGTFIPHDSLNPEVQDVSTRLVNVVHQRNKRVFVYTVLDPSLMRTLVEMGVDGLFVNDPTAGLLAAGVRA